MEPFFVELSNESYVVLLICSTIFDTRCLNNDGIGPNLNIWKYYQENIMFWRNKLSQDSYRAHRQCWASLQNLDSLGDLIATCILLRFTLFKKWRIMKVPDHNLQYFKPSCFQGLIS